MVPGGSDNGLGKGPFDMKRDDRGVWTVTTPPAVPGFHYYWLQVDGFACNDPSTQTYFGWNKECSGVEVPDKALSFYDVKNVPHGDVAATGITPRRQACGGGRWSTRRRDTTRLRKLAIPSSTCSTARARTSGLGRRRAGPTSSSIT